MSFDKEQSMIISGKNAVRQALLENKTINKLYAVSGQRDRELSEIISQAKQKKIKIEFLSKEVMDKKFGSHRGLACETVDFSYSSIEHILALAEKRQELPFVLLLDGIEDPHNFGAIIRSAECAGVHGIVIPKDRAVSVNDTVIKTSAGASLNMLIARVANLNNIIEKLKAKGLWVYACELGGSDIYKTNLKGPIAVVIGSEGKGISKLTKEKCDGVITLSMRGKVNSLNASVAAGVVLFEILRQRDEL